jgi:hypothetical protein
VNEDAHRQGRWAFGLTVMAAVWSVAILIGAFLWPAYAVESVGPGGHAVSSTQTLVQVNGLWVLVPVLIPASLTVIVWFLLHRRCSQGGRWAGAGAWTVITVLWGFTVITGFSIGELVLPISLLLTVAARLTPPAPAPVIANHV